MKSYANLSQETVRGDLQSLGFAPACYAVAFGSWRIGGDSRGAVSRAFFGPLWASA